MFLCVLIPLLVVQLARGQNPPTRVVNPPQGPVQGFLRNSAAGDPTTVFMGIPYAQPPVGDLRFRPALPLPTWSDPYPALRPGKNCPQRPELFGGVVPDEQFYQEYIQDAEYGEDCLTMNIYYPGDIRDGEDGEKLPVMVWIHGGGLQLGMSRLGTDGDMLAHQGDVIVVGIHYRLGALGWFATEDPEYNGNLGLADQRLALNWVKDNIAAFGGDPELVTIFGESAGAWSVSGHVVSPLSEGLFQRAIGQSGSVGAQQPVPLAAGINTTMTLMDRVGCLEDTVQRSMACMRRLPAAVLVNTSFEILAEDNSQILGMVADDISIPTDYKERIIAGDVRRVPILWGNCAYEAGFVYLGFPPEQNPLDRGLTPDEIRGLLTMVASTYPNPGPVYEALAAFYTPRGVDDVWENVAAGVNIIGDAIFVAPGGFKLDYMSANNIPSYEFVFAPRPTFMPRFNYTPGAFHGDEVYYAFGDYVYTNGTEEEIKLSYSMMNAWGTFARTGVPKYLDNNGVEREVPAYDPDTRRYINFDLDMSPGNAEKNNFRTEAKRLFNDVIPELGGGYSSNLSVNDLVQFLKVNKKRN